MPINDEQGFARAPFQIRPHGRNHQRHCQSFRAPAAIVAGLNPQLVNAGGFTQAKLTVELKAPLPTGTAENV